MSSTIATRTTRFAPPAPPTRKAGSRRTVVGRAPRWGVAPSGRCCGSWRTTSVRRSSPGCCRRSSRPRRSRLVETTPRRIDLDDFFAAEYDGDDQRLEVTPARASTVRLTRRGRLVVLGLGLAATLGLGLYAATVSTASDHPEQTRTVTVQPGQTLWDISSRAAAATGSGDVRSMMSHVEAINHLDSSSLQVGQHLRVPR